MNRLHYFNYIEEKLSTLATRVEIRGKLNILDLHLHSENFYLHLFNEIFDWELSNLNEIRQNIEAIDLVDSKNKVIIQVSATATKEKIEYSLSKKLLSEYSDYNFKFISISKNTSELRNKSFKNPYNLNFSPQDDIYDVSSILKKIPSDIDKQKQIYAFIKKELGKDNEPMELETNLAKVINILAKEDLNQYDSNFQTNDYAIEQKISFNNLNAAKDIIDDYNMYYKKIDNIYAEFDKQGVNKSMSVLSAMRRIYIINKDALNADDLFFKIIEAVIDKIIKSTNYETIPYDELELCVNILVVDAFIRCKIFENPQGYNYVTSR
jgi:hypothetical protein